MGTHKNKTDALHASLAGKPYSVPVMDFLRERGSRVGNDLLIGEFNLEVFAEMVHTMAFEQGYEAGKAQAEEDTQYEIEELEDKVSRLEDELDDAEQRISILEDELAELEACVL